MADAFELKNQTLLLSTEAPGGIYNSAQLKKIASLCESESIIVKATEDQRLAVFVPQNKVEKVKAEIEAIGLDIRHYQSGLHQPLTCIGEMCKDTEQDALGAAMDLTAELDEITLETPLKIGINGCARCCVPTHTLDISLIGDSSGFRINLGGKNSQIPELASFMAEGVPADKLTTLVKNVVVKYQELAEPEESLQDVMDRCGVTDFVSLLAPYSQDAAAGEDPFADFAAEEPTAQETVEASEASDLGDNDLGDADLGDADLGDTDLGDADLGDTDLGDTDLGDTDLGDTDLGDTDLGDADLGDTDLGDTDLGDADLGDTDLGDADLGDTDLGDADLGDTDLGDTDLGDTDLGDADLGDTDLSDSDLGDADLGDTDLSDSDLGDTDLGDTLSDSDLGDADLGDTDLGDTDLGETDLGDVDLGDDDISSTADLDQLEDIDTVASDFDSGADENIVGGHQEELDEAAIAAPPPQADDPMVGMDELDALEDGDTWDERGDELPDADSQIAAQVPDTLPVDVAVADEGDILAGGIDDISPQEFQAAGDSQLKEDSLDDLNIDDEFGDSESAMTAEAVADDLDFESFTPDELMDTGGEADSLDIAASGGGSAATDAPAIASSEPDELEGLDNLEDLEAEPLEFAEAEEVDDAEADAFEEKLNESIAEEEEFGDLEDDNADSRLEAVRLVETGAGSSSGASNAMDETLGLDDPGQVAGLEQAEKVAEAVDDGFGAEDSSEPGSAVSQSSGWSLQGFDLSPTGAVVLQFASGASLQIDGDQLTESRSLQVAGQTVTVTPEADGMRVDFGGIGLFIPKKKAA